MSANLQAITNEPQATGPAWPSAERAIVMGWASGVEWWR